MQKGPSDARNYQYYTRTVNLLVCKEVQEGSLKQNIESIKKELNSCRNKTRYAELWAVIDVAMELQKSILLETSTAAAIYKKRKASLTNKAEILYFRPTDTYEKLSKHVNIAQI